MNIIKKRREAGAICFICHSPDYKMVGLNDVTGRPMFECGQCGDRWTYGKDGGKFKKLAEVNHE